MASNRDKKKERKKEETIIYKQDDNDGKNSLKTENATSAILNSDDLSFNSVDARKNTDRVVDRLDLQLLIAIIVLFVSAWAFLCNKICDFTNSTDLNEQLCYILAHYILTVSLFLCIYITSIKGGYTLANTEDISISELGYFKLFMNSWHVILLLEFLILLFANYISWWFWLLILPFILVYQMIKVKLCKTKSILLTCVIIFCFPLFVSIISNVIKEIDVIVDKDYYNLDEDVLVTVNVRGYACDYHLVKPSEEDLFSNSKYEKKKNMLIIPASIIKNNSLAVGVIGPANGTNFLVYPYYKFFGKDKMLEYSDSTNNKFVYFKKISINIRP